MRLHLLMGATKTNGAIKPLLLSTNSQAVITMLCVHDMKQAIDVSCSMGFAEQYSFALEMLPCRCEPDATYVREWVSTVSFGEFLKHVYDAFGKNTYVLYV